MSDQLTIVGGSKPASRGDRVRELFEAVGGAMSTNMFTHELIDRGIYGEDDRDLAFFRYVQRDSTRHLKAPDKTGLPFAGQTTTVDDAGQHVWKQRKMWMFADYSINITEHIRNRDQNHHAALLLRDECFDRFGEAPEITSLEGIGATENFHAAD